MPFIGQQPKIGAYKLLDSITTSATATYALTASSTAYFPELAQNLIVSLNGVTQAPISAYTVSGSNIVFASALTSSDVIDYILALGDVLSVGSTTNPALPDLTDVNINTGTLAGTHILGYSTVSSAWVNALPSVWSIPTTSQAISTITWQSSSKSLNITRADATFGPLTLTDVAIENSDATFDNLTATGGLTVDTNTLVVDSTNNAVGINTVTASGPQSTFHIEQNGDDADGGFRLSRDNALASYTQYIDTGSSWNLAYGNPSSDDSPTDILSVTNQGNVGIGDNSPTDQLSISKNSGNSIKLETFVGNTNDSTFKFHKARGGNSGPSQIGTTDDLGTITWSGYDGSSFNEAAFIKAKASTNTGDFDASLSFGTSSEAMRIDSNGNLLVGYTSDGFTSNPRIAAKGFATKQGFNGALRSNNFNFAWVSSSLQAWIDVTNIGNVSVSSDYRIKRNIESMSEPALARIAQLRPVTYQPASFRNLFEESDEVKEGFIAHELQEIIPSAVDGEKDSEDQIQSLKVDALCAVLTKAIQEQQTIIDSQASAIADLTTRLEALENN